MSARRAPGWLVLVFGLAVAVAVLLTGPLLLFAPAAVLARWAEAHESLGRALMELGKNDEAAEHLRNALRILRSTPAAR